MATQGGPGSEQALHLDTDAIDITMLLGLHDAARDGVLIVDSQRRILHYNTAFAGLWGFSPRDLETGDARSLIQKACAKVTDPKAFLAWSETFYENPGTNGEDLVSLTDGRFLERYTAPIHNQTGSVVARAWFYRDITHRHNAEAELSRQRARLASLLSKSPVATIISRLEDGAVVYANPRASQLFHLGISQLVGRDLAGFYLHGEVRYQLIRRFKDEGFVHDAEVELRNAQGVPFWALVTLEPYPDLVENAVISWIYDITDRKRHELALQAAKLEAERSDRAKTAFLAMISHEIRTPLTGVLGMVELASHTELSNQQQEYLDTITVSARSLLGILDDILDLSHLDAEDLPLESAPFDLSRLVSQTLGLFQPQAQGRGLQVEFHFDPTLPSLVVGDSRRLRQVLSNLLSNALKFTHQGGLGLSVDKAGGQNGTIWVRFSVSDTGIGIEDEDQSRLFSEFVQADGSLSRRYGGAGLGLAICKRLVTRMGGDIGLESQHGQGSRFWFSLPFSLAETAPEPQPSLSVIPRDGPCLHILLTEDNPVNQKVARAMLVQCGHQVTVAANGREAVDALSSHHSFDLVFMDMQMPVMDGLTATRAIRQLPSPTGSIPIIAMTANAFQEDANHCIEAGMNGYLAKPVNLNDLTTAISDFFPQRLRK